MMPAPDPRAVPCPSCRVPAGDACVPVVAGTGAVYAEHIAAHSHPERRRAVGVDPRTTRVVPAALAAGQAT